MSLHQTGDSKKHHRHKECGLIIFFIKLYF